MQNETHDTSAPTGKKASAEAEARLRELVNRYPQSRSAVMPALYIAQQEFGYLTSEAIQWVSRGLDLPPAHVVEVATFYTMYYKKPVGQYHIQICRTLSCMLCGARNLTGYVKDRLKVEAGEITSDGFWSFEEVECLGSCGTAPMLQINDVFFENLTPESLGALMDRVEREKPLLRYDNVKEELQAGFPDVSKSQIWTK